MFRTLFFWPARGSNRAFHRFALGVLVQALLVAGCGNPVSAQMRRAIVESANSSQASTRVTLPGVAARLRQHRHLTIVAFGSSSTEGIGASSPAHSYPALLQRDLQQMLGPKNEVTVINRGIGGQDADDMLARLDRDVLAAKPDLVIWQTGTNDPLRDVPLSRFIEETRDVIQRMKATGIEVILMEPQDCRMLRALPVSQAYREAVRSLGEQMNVPVIRRFDLVKSWLAAGEVTEAQLMSPDGLHMADEGYARLAAEVARELVADADLLARRLAVVAR
jgi:acyl-CoA thioesterase I